MCEGLYAGRRVYWSVSLVVAFLVLVDEYNGVQGERRRRGEGVGGRGGGCMVSAWSMDCSFFQQGVCGKISQSHMSAADTVDVVSPVT